MARPAIDERSGAKPPPTASIAAFRNNADKSDCHDLSSPGSLEAVLLQQLMSGFAAIGPRRRYRPARAALRSCRDSPPSTTRRGRRPASSQPAAWAKSRGRRPRPRFRQQSQARGLLGRLVALPFGSIRRALSGHSTARCSIRIDEGAAFMRSDAETQGSTAPSPPAFASAAL